MIYLLLEILITTQVQLISAIMSDEEILKAFEEKQNSENADNKDNTETLSDTKTETTENTTDKTDKVADLDKDAKVDADKSEETASDNALYKRPI